MIEVVNRLANEYPVIAEHVEEYLNATGGDEMTTKALCKFREHGGDHKRALSVLEIHQGKRKCGKYLRVAWSVWEKCLADARS